MDSEIKLGKSDSAHAPEASRPKRNQFGSGRLGQKIYNLVNSGVPCERIISGPNGETVICGKPAIGSVDHPFDEVLICSLECAQAVGKMILDDAMTQGRQWRIGHNGFDRP